MSVVVLRDFKKLNPTKNGQARAVAIGNFDGLHLGHQRVLECMKQRAQALNLIPSVFTFWPHPAAVLRPEKKVPLLMTSERRVEALDAFGVQFILEQTFHEEFSKLSAHDFFEKVMLEKMQAKVLVVGPDFRFGAGRTGDLKLLKELCEAAKVELKIVEPLVLEDGVCSSSRIRAFLAEGEIKSANVLLGRHFFYEGQVVKGDQRGRTLGFPTANLELDPALIGIKTGVYAGYAKIFDGNPNTTPAPSLAGLHRYAAVANIGVRPTFAGKDGPLPLRVEVHLLDFGKDIYGKTLAFEFVARGRDEKKFSSLTELQTQIEQDSRWARGSL